MNKTTNRQKRLLKFLISRGTGVINISNAELSALMGCSEATIKRDLNEMDNNSIIIRETHLITQSGKTVKQRDIILPGEKPRRFTLNQHRQLADRKNHNIFTLNGEVMWNRRIDGEWQRNMSEKEFVSEEQARSWLYGTIHNHYKNYTSGDKYIKR